MTKEEIKSWIDRWSKLKPSPKRDMVIKIWSKLLQNKQPMKQLTAMQLMLRYLEDKGLEKSGAYYKAKHLLEVEKEQIMKAVYDGYYQEGHYDVRGYYQETYGKKEEEEDNKE